jgi:hypothetical protein
MQKNSKMSLATATNKINNAEDILTKIKNNTINHGEFEKGKVIFITSAYLKTSDIYKRFKYFYERMVDGDGNFFVCCLDYKVGIQAKIFDMSDIEEERNKPTMTKESFDYELIASSI